MGSENRGNSQDTPRVNRIIESETAKSKVAISVE
jgi:hypothetical protein